MSTPSFCYQRTSRCAVSVSSVKTHVSVSNRLGWILVMCLCFLFSGAAALIEVDQPAVVAVALGQDAVLPCELRASEDETILTTPVLYWYDGGAETRLSLLNSETKYAGRAQRLDQNLNSSNKSIVLKKVQWSDSQSYECKLSVSTAERGSFRKKGNQTRLLIYDSMVFNRHNTSLLRCEVNVSENSGFILSIIHGGRTLQSVDSDPEISALNQTNIRLSHTVFLPGGGNYECQLRLGKHLITTSIFHINLHGWATYPEPWLLYAALLLVPVLVLLSLVTAMLTQR